MQLLADWCRDPDEDRVKALAMLVPNLVRGLADGLGTFAPDVLQGVFERLAERCPTHVSTTPQCSPGASTCLSATGAVNAPIAARSCDCCQVVLGLLTTALEFMDNWGSLRGPLLKSLALTTIPRIAEVCSAMAIRVLLQLDVP
jgi:hypothetical protein